MKVDLVFSADMINEEVSEGKTAIVIDTLRATSTIIKALDSGAERVIPVLSIKEAKKHRSSLGQNYLICGERGGIKVDGFDLGNSPRSYLPEVLSSKVVVLTTTNGTRCFSRLANAQEVLVASLLNIKAIIDYIKEKEEILFCCAGIRGDFALDDFITAGAIISRLKERDLNLSDEALVAKSFYLQHKNDLLDLLKCSRSGQNLIKLGKEADIDYIYNETEIKLLPLYKDGSIIKQEG
ncbi:2-phosphosulfolactate phosphatase [Halonatronum saccharophilum]|uniref:2-phosphosulfolactate phosphatase n=1 Tax=Halonatronum saccharophilum TaxID=150060 RepID=UPI0004808521|nr:2-phosphosulfolactate phosphatase [Halonatronum saccharophilum]